MWLQATKIQKLCETAMIFIIKNVETQVLRLYTDYKEIALFSFLVGCFQHLCIGFLTIEQDVCHR